MATLKQYRLARTIAKNPKITASQALQISGYSKNTNLSDIKKSTAFQQLLDRYLPDDLILGSLEEDIKLKPQNRVKELELASKIKRYIGTSPFEESGKDIIGLVGIVVKKPE